MPTRISSADQKPIAWAERLSRLGLLGPNEHPIILVPLLALLIFVVRNWSRTIVAIIREYNPLPVWDYWQVPEHFARYKAFDLGVLWLQHNEHRIVFPEIVFAIDMLLFRGRQIFALSVSFLCYFGIWMVLAWVLESDREVAKAIRRMAILLTGIIIGWQGSSVVVGNTFLLQWTMLQVAVASSLALLAVSRRSAGWFEFAGAILFASVATFSSGNGMLLWPVLIIAALVMRLPRLRVSILTAAALLNVCVFFIGYRSSNELKLLGIIKHPLYFVDFVSAYLSMPVGVFSKPEWAIHSGLFVLITFLILFGIALRKHLIAQTPAIVFFGAFAFTLASAVLTAAGRMNPADPMLISPRAARYVTLPLENWGTLVLTLIWITARLNLGRWLPALMGLIVAVCLWRVGPRLNPWISGNDSFIADQQVATLAVENGLLDPAFNSKLYGDPRFVPAMLPVLSNNHLAIFSGTPEMSWLGRSVDTAVRSCAGQQASTSSAVFPVEGGFAVVGNQPLASRNARVLFVNDKSRIVGFGERMPAGVPAIAGGQLSGHSRHWVGFLNSSYGGSSFSTFSADRNGQILCRLEQAIGLVSAERIKASDIGAPIARISWSGTGWVTGLLPPHVDEPNPATNVFWSSWNSTDASTGKLTSSVIAVPPNHCLALSVLHGPSTDGLSVKIVDEKTDKTAEIVPLRGGDTSWNFWRIPLEPETVKIRILASDGGADWGQWAAIASPWECK